MQMVRTISGHPTFPRPVIQLMVLLLLTGVVLAQTSRFKAGRVLVQARAGLPEQALAKILEEGGGTPGERIPGTDIYLVAVPAGRETAVARIWNGNPAIQFAELDRLLPPEDLTANDPYFDSAWHLPRIGAPAAWEYSLANGIVVAVLDTGVDANHPDLTGQLVSGWNVYDDNPDTSDVYGHGTKVAGTIAAASNNGIGVTSVAWEASIMPVRISQPDGYAYFSTIAQGLIWAADHGARVANISYAASGSLSIQDAGAYMRSLGGLVTVSAGNSGRNEAFSPSPSLLSVSATNSGDGFASWSSYGQYVDLSAPGVGIWSTTRGGGYGSASGTSFSSPIVAGVIALMMAANPVLTPSELEDVLLGSALDLGSEGYDIYFGYGRVDAAEAVRQVSGASPPPDTLAPSVFIVSPTGGTVSGTIFVDVSASDDRGVASVELYANSGAEGVDNFAPYQFAVDTLLLPDGPLTLEAVAYDQAGNWGASEPLDLLVDNTPQTADITPPDIAITSPLDGATVQKTVTVSVQADDDRELSSATLAINGQVVQASNGSFAYSWNTRREDPGAQTLQATARDAAGNESSMTIQVWIDASSKGGGKRNRPE